MEKIELVSGMPRLVRMRGMRSGCGDALRALGDGWELMRWERWGRKDDVVWFLHRGPMMGGEDRKVLPSAADDLVARGLVAAVGVAMNGVVTVYRAGKD